MYNLIEQIFLILSFHYEYLMINLKNVEKIGTFKCQGRECSA